MIYKEFKGIKLSALGLGCMRFPVVDGTDNKIDQDALEEMVKYAIDRGINYFDTAWMYHGGTSENAIGQALSKYSRESFYLADKFPGFDAKNMERVSEIFEEQLKRCNVEYFDFYLFHNVCEKNIDAYLDPQYGLMEYLLEQKKNGRIKYLGFSCHGAMPVLKRFLDAYGKHMEFCQLQINYIDWRFQAAEDKVRLLDQYSIPVWVMEPLRGGRLVKLTENEIGALKAVNPERTVPAWAFRFLQTIPSVVVTLSGMSNMEQLKQNIETYATEEALSKEEWDTLLKLGKDMTNPKSLPCTSCKYCTSHCPKGLDIPHLISLYNEFSFSNGGFLAPMVVSTMPEDKRPSACIGCRSCEEVCPQHLKISEAFAEMSSKL